MIVNEYRSLAAIKHDSKSCRITFQTKLISHVVGSGYCIDDRARNGLKSKPSVSTVLVLGRELGLGSGKGLQVALLGQVNGELSTLYMPQTCV